MRKVHIPYAVACVSAYRSVSSNYRTEQWCRLSVRFKRSCRFRQAELGGCIAPHAWTCRGSLHPIPKPIGPRPIACGDRARKTGFGPFGDPRTLYACKSIGIVLDVRRRASVPHVRGQGSDPSGVSVHSDLAHARRPDRPAARAPDGPGCGDRRFERTAPSSRCSRQGAISCAVTEREAQGLHCR